MKFLYGDSTASPLKANFLEFLRDTIDFSVFALQTDESIALGKDRVRSLSLEAEAELERLDALVEIIGRSIDRADKGATDSPAARYSTRVQGFVAGAHRESVNEVRHRLGELVKQLDGREASARASCRAALAAFLAKHDPPDATTELRLTLGSEDIYEATLTGRSSFRLEWGFQLFVPEGNLWGGPVRIEAVAPHLEVRAPQVSGWINKGVKTRAQKLDRHVITEFSDNGSRANFKIRLERGVDVGFDVDVDPSAQRVTMARVGHSEDAASGPFEVNADDAPAIFALVDRLRIGAGELTRATLVRATLDGAEFATQPLFRELVRRLVALTAPIVREIAARSSTPNQLVLRRLLGNDRREEIFVQTETLRMKYATLSKSAAEMFVPLGLDPADRSKANGHAKRSNEPGRMELAPSRPPPAPSSPSLPSAQAGSFGPSPSPPSDPTPSSSLPRLSAPSVEFSPHEQVTRPSGRSHELARNEALVAALKNIAHLARSGRTDDAYRAYAALYSSVPFAQYSPEDQRLAVRLMLLAKAPPTMKSDAVFAAHHAAVARLESLISSARDPADYELLGVACIVLGDPDAAEAALEAGLEIAVEKNSDAALTERIKRRLGALHQ